MKRPTPSASSSALPAASPFASPFASPAALPFASPAALPAASPSASPAAFRFGPSLAAGVLGIAASLLAPLAAHAGGLVIPGNGAVATGRAGASVASIDDATAIAINPAGLAGIHGTMISLGLSLIDYHLTVDRAGTYDDVMDRDDPWENQPFAPVSDDSSPPIGLGSFQVVPVFAIASDLGGKVKGLTVAAGVYAPNAYPTRSMGADYVLEEAGVAPPPTRYDIVKQEAAVVLPSIAAGYRINEQLDVGARFSAGFANLEATTYVWGLDNFDEWAGQDSQFHVKASDNFVPAFGLGARYRPTDSIELGAAWSSAIDIHARGTGDAITGSGAMFGGIPAVVVPIDDDQAACEKGGVEGSLKACVDFALPMQASLGGRWILRDDLGRQTVDVELDLQWEQWSGGNASEYQVGIDGFVQVGAPGTGFPLNPTVIRHNFKDTFSARLGGSWQQDVGPGRLTLRGGVAYDTAAARTNWERADIDGAARTMVTAGASYALKKVRFDLGGGAVLEPSREQGTLCNPGGPGTPDDPNCAGGPAVTGPDPVQPLKDPTGQSQSPYAAGTYDSGYAVILLGASTWF
jgi:long-subunit fatty acid transport protein